MPFGSGEAVTFVDWLRVGGVVAILWIISRVSIQRWGQRPDLPFSDRSQQQRRRLKTILLENSPPSDDEKENRRGRTG